MTIKLIGTEIQAGGQDCVLSHADYKDPSHLKH